MGYFPNGSAGAMYQEKYCFNCVHYGPDVDNAAPGCAVWDLHLLHNYDEDMKPLLDHLIPREKNEDGHRVINARCRMFIPATLDSAVGDET